MTNLNTEKYIQNLFDLKFKKWNSEIIDHIITLYEINDFSNHRTHLYILFNNYINWYNKNQNDIIHKKNDQYSYEKLLIIKNKMKSFINISSLDSNENNIISNKNNNYEYYDEFDHCEVNDYTNYIFTFILFVIFILFIHNLFGSFKNNNIETHTVFPTKDLFNNHFPDIKDITNGNILDNPIIKLFVNKFL
jgi:hypothetical protein